MELLGLVIILYLAKQAGKHNFCEWFPRFVIMLKHNIGKVVNISVSDLSMGMGTSPFSG